MKFCPYCGADLLDSKVLFCAQCGAKLPPHEAGRTEPLKEDMRSASQEPKTRTYKGKKKKQRQQESERQPAIPKEEGTTEVDGYDGYYDDVLPPDLDRTRDGIDKDLVKKIIVLGVCVVLIISLCVVMMYVL